jgi:hypothetical protein
MSDAFEAMLARTLGERMKSNNDLCKDVWAALANVTWYHPESKQEYSCSFRYAGGLIADLRGEGDYMDWYCCAPNASITDEIRRTFKKEGWIADDMSTICQAPGCLKDADCGWPHDTGYRWTCGEHMHDRSWITSPKADEAATNEDT